MDEEELINSDPDFEYLTIDETDQADLLVYEDEDYVLDADGTLITREMAKDIQTSTAGDIDQTNVSGLTDEDLAIFMAYADPKTLEALKTPVFPPDKNLAKKSLAKSLRELTTSLRSIPISSGPNPLYNLRTFELLSDSERTFDPVNYILADSLILIVNNINLTDLMHLRAASVRWREFIEEKLRSRSIIFNIERIDEYAALFDNLRPITERMSLQAHQKYMDKMNEANQATIEMAYLSDHRAYQKLILKTSRFNRWLNRWHILTNPSCLIYLDFVRRSMKEVNCYMEDFSSKSIFIYENLYSNVGKLVLNPPRNKDIVLNIYANSVGKLRLLGGALPAVSKCHVFCCFNRKTCLWAGINCTGRGVESEFNNAFFNAKRYSHLRGNKFGFEFIHNDLARFG